RGTKADGSQTAGLVRSRYPAPDGLRLASRAPGGLTIIGLRCDNARAPGARTFATWAAECIRCPSEKKTHPSLGHRHPPQRQSTVIKRPLVAGRDKQHYRVCAREGKNFREVAHDFHTPGRELY